MSGLLHDVTQFLYEEAQLLDERRFREWLALFTDDGYYWAPIDPDQKSREDGFSIINEAQAGMLIRINRLEHQAAFTEQPPRRTCRSVTNIVIVKEASTEIKIRSKLTMHDYRVCDASVDEARVFCGTQTHCLEKRNGGFAIASKRFDMISSEAALPVLSVPF